MRFIGVSFLWLAHLFLSVIASQIKDDEVEKFLLSMTLEQKINQMAQIDISKIFTDGDIDDAKINSYFGEQGVGSLLITPVGDNYFNATVYRSIIKQVQNAAKARNMPPVIAGIDSVHGANYIKGAVMFPQQLNIASTFNPEHAKYAGKIAARDTLASGINWLFSPILGLGMQPLWARMYETFGEDPHVVGQFASKMIEGIQENKKSAACAKHFVGYSAPRTGHDRSPSWIPTRHLYQYFVRPWRKVIKDANPLTIMESYTEYDGVPNVANRESLNVLLRQDLGFDGVLVTDYQEVENLFSWHHVAADIDEAVQMTLTEGSVDLNMLPFNIEGWMHGVSNQKNVESRIDESVRRILHIKNQLGMFDDSVLGYGEEDIEAIGNSEVRKTALDMARESIVLAENNFDTILPISDNFDGENVKVHVTGPTSDSIAYQTGGWTIQWQGAKSDSDFTYGKTVLNAAKNIDSWDVTSSCGTDILGNPCSDEDEAGKIAGADYIIICIGEENYTGQFDVSGEIIEFCVLLISTFVLFFDLVEKPGDIRHLALPQGQLELVRRMREHSTAKIIVVYFGGRPRLLGDIVHNSDALMLAFLPGPIAGRAVVDLITGKHNFSGKLPITYPKFEDMGGVPYWHTVTDQCTGPEDSTEPLPHYWYKQCDVEWAFGHGRSYTTFEYNKLKSATDQVIHACPWSEKEPTSVEISVNVKNTGYRAGLETVMFFLFVESRHVTPEYKLLVHFERIELQPFEEKAVSFNLTPESLKYVGPHDDKHDILQMNQKFYIGVGAHTDCRTDQKELCTELITLKMIEDEIYDPACERACNILEEQSCLKVRNLSQKECYDKCLASPSINPNESGWGWNYVSCIETFLLDSRTIGDKCNSVRSLCRDVFVNETVNEAGDSKTEWDDKPTLADYKGAKKHSVFGIVVIFSAILSSICMAFVVWYACFGFFFAEHDIEEISREKDIEFTSIAQEENEVI